MGPPLKKPPVYFTVVQVRFNPVLKLTDAGRGADPSLFTMMP